MFCVCVCVCGISNGKPHTPTRTSSSGGRRGVASPPPVDPPLPCLTEFRTWGRQREREWTNGYPPFASQPAYVRLVFLFTFSLLSCCATKKYSVSILLFLFLFFFALVVQTKTKTKKKPFRKQYKKGATPHPPTLDSLSLLTLLRASRRSSHCCSTEAVVQSMRKMSTAEHLFATRAAMGMCRSSDFCSTEVAISMLKSTRAAVQSFCGSAVAVQPRSDRRSGEQQRTVPYRGARTPSSCRLPFTLCAFFPPPPHTHPPV